MKKLTTLLMGALLLGTQSMTAQDTSTWTAGQDVSDQLQWLDYDGSTNGAWKGVEGMDYAGGPAFDGTNKDWEMFNAKEGSMAYQVFFLPAGVYTFSVQAFYRAAYQKEYWDGTEQINAELFAQPLTKVSDETEDEEGNIIEAVYEATGNAFTAPLLSIASSEVTGACLFEAFNDNGDREWFSDVEYQHDGTNYYVPNSMTGARYYFDEGYYAGDENGNRIKVIQMEDGYIKLGIRKTGAVGSDWCLWSNFTATYEGDAGEAAKLAIAQENFENALAKAGQLEGKLTDFLALQYYFSDDLAKIEEAADDAESIEGYEAGVAALTDLQARYNGYVSDARTLGTIITLSESTAANTDFAGKADFQTAIAAAKAVLDAEFEEGSAPTIGGPDAYSNALNTLAGARADYAMSKGAVDGAYDFMSLIAYPFFCHPEFEPKWNESTQRFESIDLVLNGGEWNGQTWEGCRNDLHTQKQDDGKNQILIGQGLEIGTNKESIYTWYQYNTTGYEPYFDHQLPSAKQWATPGSERGISQNLVGLPNGFYSLKGMANTWMNDWDANDPAKKANLGIRLTAGDQTVQSQQETEPHGWWSQNRDEWQTYTTDLIEVKDGRATVTFFANGFSTFTAMQLYYYGADPDFTAMVRPQADAAAQAAEEQLILAGDKAAVAAILATIPEQVNGIEAYREALAAIADAQAYTATAVNVTNNNDLTSLYFAYQQNFDPESAEYAALDPAIAKTDEAYAAEATTYKDIQTYRADYDAYVHYFTTVSAFASKAGDNADFQNVKAEQQTYLASNYADAARLAEFEAALAAPYNAAVMAQLGDLSKATVDNPIDITALVINPSFTEGSKGWNGALTVDGELQSAERYNTNFDINQTIYSLPKGVYEVRVKSFYRDGGLSAAFQHTWYPVEAEEGDDFKANVQLYAGENTQPVVSICNIDAVFSNRSFTEYTYLAEDPNSEEEDPELRKKPLRRWCEDKDSVNPDGETIWTLTSYEQQYTSDGEIITAQRDDAWTYDSRLVDIDESFFFPNSMRGATARFKNDNGAYTNTVRTAITEPSGNLTFGLRKSETIGDDWCMMDDFQLFYLGADETAIQAVGISGTTAASTTAQSVYTLGGLRTGSLQKGMNIVRMSDGTVKKVYVK